MIGDAHLYTISSFKSVIDKHAVTDKRDFSHISFNMILVSVNQFSCTINASLDLFDRRNNSEDCTTISFNVKTIVLYLLMIGKRNRSMSYH